LDPKEINQTESQLNRLFESVEPNPDFANHLENKLIQVARGRLTNQKNSLHRPEPIRFRFTSVGQWGITLVGLGILVIVLAYSINRLIPPAHIPTANQPGNVPLAPTNIPTIQQTDNTTSTVAVRAPVLSPTAHSRIAIDSENVATSVFLRSCPSTGCAVVGEMLAGQQVMVITAASKIGLMIDAAPRIPNRITNTLAMPTK